MSQLVIFDCDGTLADSQNAIWRAMVGAFDAHGLKTPDRQDVLGVVGLSLVEAMARLQPDAETDELVALSDGYKAAFARLRQDPAHEEPLFEGIGEVVHELAGRDGVLLGIATGKSTRGVARLLDKEGLSQVFVTIQTADDHPSKPHPSMIAQAMSETGAAPEKTVMIGDTVFDMEMAIAAGVGAIGVSWGYHPVAALENSGAHRLVRAANELPGAIDDVLQLRAVAA